MDNDRGCVDCIWFDECDHEELCDHFQPCEDEDPEGYGCDLSSDREMFMGEWFEYIADYEHVYDESFF